GDRPRVRQGGEAEQRLELCHALAVVALADGPRQRVEDVGAVEVGVAAEVEVHPPAEAARELVAELRAEAHPEVAVHPGGPGVVVGAGAAGAVVLPAVGGGAGAEADVEGAGGPLRLGSGGEEQHAERGDGVWEGEGAEHRREDVCERALTIGQIPPRFRRAAPAGTAGGRPAAWRAALRHRARGLVGNTGVVSSPCRRGPRSRPGSTPRGGSSGRPDPGPPSGCSSAPRRARGPRSGSRRSRWRRSTTSPPALAGPRAGADRAPAGRRTR